MKIIKIISGGSGKFRFFKDRYLVTDLQHLTIKNLQQMHFARALIPFFFNNFVIRGQTKGDLNYIIALPTLKSDSKLMYEFKQSKSTVPRSGLSGRKVGNEGSSVRTLRDFVTPITTRSIALEH